MGLSQTCEIKLKNKFQRGNRNLITDIPGVRVGQVTLQNAEKAIHTGVTVILPHGGNLFKEKVPAGVHYQWIWEKCRFDTSAGA